MTPLFFFFTLCVSYSGGQEDCSYEWQIIDDRQHFESLYDMYQFKNIDPSTVQGFRVHSERQIFVYDAYYTYDVLLHEIDHVYCSLNNSSPEDVLDCDNKIELRDYGSFDSDTRTCNWCTIHEKPKHDVWRQM